MTSTVVLTRALWAGPGARRVLSRAGTGVVEFALHPGGYARLGEEWLLLAVPRAPRGPLTLLVADLAAAPLAAGDEVALEYDFAPRERADAERRVVTKAPVRCLSDHAASRGVARPAGGRGVATGAARPVTRGAVGLVGAARSVTRSEAMLAGAARPATRGEVALGVAGPATGGDVAPAGAARPATRDDVALEAAGGDVALSAAPPAAGHDVAAAAGAMLRAGALRIDLAGLARSPLTRAEPLAPGWRAALGAALVAAPDSPLAFSPGLSALRRGDVVEAVAELAGRGEGLTPAGDDVLAGYAAWCHAQGRVSEVVALAASRSAPLGLAYLRCAERGELAEPAAAVLRAIRAADAGAAARRARGLSRWGASSGAALLWGIAAGASG